MIVTGKYKLNGSIEGDRFTEKWRVVTREELIEEKRISRHYTVEESLLLKYIWNKWNTDEMGGFLKEGEFDWMHVSYMFIHSDLTNLNLDLL